MSQKSNKILFLSVAESGRRLNFNAVNVNILNDNSLDLNGRNFAVGEVMYALERIMNVNTLIGKKHSVFCAAESRDVTTNKSCLAIFQICIGGNGFLDFLVALIVTPNVVNVTIEYEFTTRKSFLNEARQKLQVIIIVCRSAILNGR